MKIRWIAVGCTIGLAITSFSGCGNSKNPVLITAHRGDSSMAPENTLAAFEKAIEAGADFIELDVTETKDGVLVILHDNSLERTAELEKNVWEITYDEIQELDAGSWFSEEYAGERIPTLQEVIDVCKGEIKLNIEIKSTGFESEEFIDKIVSCIQENELQEECIVTSFNYSMVQEVKSIDESIKTGIVLSGDKQELSKFNDMDLFSISYKILDKDMVEEAHAMGKAVHVWTVNEKSDLRKFQKMGVDSIITNYPKEASKICNGR